MAGPWDKYGGAAQAPAQTPAQQAPAGPWSNYQQGQQQQPPEQPSTPWSQVVGEGIANFPSSALETGKALIQPFVHPIDTLTDAVNLGLGIGQHIRGVEGGPTEQMQMASAVKKFYVDRYGSVEGFKQALAKDPAGILADFSGFLSGGEGVLMRIPGMARVAELARVMNPATHVSEGISKIVTPTRSSEATQQAARILDREGVQVTAGQRTGSKPLRYAESEIGGARAAERMERQGEQFTRATLRRIGVDADRATPDVLEGGYNRIGQQFEGLSARNDLTPDQQMIDDLVNVRDAYNESLGEHARAPKVANAIDDIINTVTRHGPNGTPDLTGNSYQAYTSWLARQARNANTPELQQAMYGIREALDNAMERTIAQRNPDDLGAWRQARTDYRNYLVVEKAATGAGEKAAQGTISPAQLRQATISTHGRRDYALGRSDFSELARAGEATMKPLPESGTSSRLAARGGGGRGTGLTVAGALIGGPIGAALGAGADMAIGGLKSRLLMSRLGQGYLGNQAMSPRMRQATEALVKALTANRVAQEPGRKDRAGGPR